MDYSITYRKKNKGWQYIINYKQDGKWKQKSKQGFASKKEAKPHAMKMAKELEKAVKDNVITEYSGITFRKFVEIFISDLGIQNEANTMICCKSTLKKFKKLDDMKLKDITNIDIQEIINNICEEGSSKYITVKDYLQRLKTCFNSAIKNYNIISTNPAKSVKIRVDKSCENKRNNKKALTKNELDKVLDDNILKGMMNGEYYIVALLAGSCGLRIGETLGLTWQDINSKDMELNIDKQWKKIRKKNEDGTFSIIYDFGDLKSKNSYRKVPLSPTTYEELMKYKKKSPLAINNDPYNNRLVKSYAGTVKIKLDAYLRKNYGICVHELRHTYATLLIATGIDFKTVAQILGHDVAQTIHTYSHVTSDMFKNAAEKINNIF